MRLLLCLLFAGIVPANAGERSPPLALATMRDLIAAGGLNRGKVFALGDDRYAIGGVVVDQRGREFTIRVLIVPLQKIDRGTRDR